MSLNIPTHYVDKFTTNLQVLLQEKGRLRPAVMEAPASGEGAVAVDQFGAVEATEVVDRFAPMPRTDAATQRVWVYPRIFHIPQMIDTFDKAKLMLDPTSTLVSNAALGMMRKTDTIIFDAFFADMKTGVGGAGTQSFDTTNHRVDAAVGAAADSGLNVDKILAGRQILREANVDVDNEEVFVGITPQQENDLLKQYKVTSGDFNTNLDGSLVLKDGKVTRFAGCNIIVSNLVQANSSYRLCPMWVKSGVHLGVWRDVSARQGQRTDVTGMPDQLYTDLMMGATRTEAGRVVQIECTEA